MLTLNRRIKDNLFEFIDEGWLFNYMDELNTKLRNFNEKSWIDKEYSDRNEMYIMLELDSSKHEITERYTVARIEEFKDFYNEITEGLKSEINQMF